MIGSFKDRVTEELWRKGYSRRLGSVLSRVSRRKLAQIRFATRLEDLRVPPGNRLESLRGDRTGQYSIRVNDQWRICFVWRESEAYDVELVDYH
jgi:proteic killer suppression protein